MSLRVQTFETGPLATNAYLLTDDDSGEAIVIDPSIGGDAVLDSARAWQKNGGRLLAIWATHGHFDHIYDGARWKDEFSIPLLAHRADEFWFERLREQSLWLGLPPPAPVHPDAWLEDGQVLNIGEHRARVLHVPGHSPGSVAFWWESQNWCVSGDVLFQDSVGRTDLPGCSLDALRASLRVLLALPGATRILPGHGPATTVALEKANNPFCLDLD